MVLSSIEIQAIASQAAYDIISRSHNATIKPSENSVESKKKRANVVEEIIEATPASNPEPVVKEDDPEEECHCDTLKPMEKWLSEEDEGAQCHECILTPIADFYLGALQEANAESQIKQLKEAWVTADLLTIGKVMDKVKSEVGETLKKRLINFDCLAQTYKPEAAEEDK